MYNKQGSSATFRECSFPSETQQRIIKIRTATDRKTLGGSYIKLAECEVNTQKTTAFLHTSNELEFYIKNNAVYISITPPNEINLTKYVKDPYEEKYKTLMNKTKELNSGDIIQKDSTMSVSALPNFTYRVNKIPIKSQQGILWKSTDLFPCSYGEANTQSSQHNMKENRGALAVSDFKTYCVYSYGNQDRSEQRWWNRRTCAHLLLQEHQNHN